MVNVSKVKVLLNDEINTPDFSLNQLTKSASGCIQSLKFIFDFPGLKILTILGI